MGTEGAEGLITYMRTDSVRIAPEALTEARKLIAKQYGTEYLPDQPRMYATKKAAQDAHEAIRPTNLKHPPAVRGTYSGASSGADGAAGPAPAEGPMQSPES